MISDLIALNFQNKLHTDKNPRQKEPKAHNWKTKQKKAKK